MDRKTSLINLCQQVTQRERSIYQQLSVAECSAIGTPECWSVKDIIVHIALWKELYARNLDLIAAGKTAQAPDDIDKTNDDFYQAHRNDSWRQVVDNSRRIHNAWIAAISATEMENLDRDDLIAGGKERPLWRMMASVGVLHPGIHLTQILIDLGDNHGALSTIETTVESLKPLDDDPIWLGLLHYDLACSYAQVSRIDDAMQNLRVALDLDPGLRDWSRQDPDLKALQNEPEFESITRARKS